MVDRYLVEKTGETFGDEKYKKVQVRCKDIKCPRFDQNSNFDDSLIPIKGQRSGMKSFDHNDKAIFHAFTPEIGIEFLMHTKNGEEMKYHWSIWIQSL